MKQHALGLSAFSLPKLKRDVAAKLPPSSRSGDAGQHSSGSPTEKQQAAEDSHNSKDTGNENVDPASSHLGNVKAAGKQPATARKASRRAKQVRASEQHTVYYDALGSPDGDAGARTQHNLRGGGAAAAAAAAAPAPAPVRSKPSSRQPAAAAAAATAGAEAGDAGTGASAGPDSELFTSQPEPMEEDEDEPYAAACAGPAGKTPAAGRKTTSRSTARQQLQDREAQHVPRPSSRQQRHAAEQSGAAAAAASRKHAAAAAAAAEAHDTQQDSRQQPQRRAAGGRSGRSSAGQAVEEAAAMALDTSDSDGGSEPAATAGRQGSQDHLRDGQEIYK